MSVFDNEKHVLAGRTTSSDHVVSMNMAADAQRPLTKSCVHQTCIDGGSESLINQNYTNRSTSIEIDRTRARKSKTSDNIQKEKKSEGWRSNGCTCSISLVSICLSLLLLGAVTYIYFTREETNVVRFLFLFYILILSTITYYIHFIRVLKFNLKFNNKKMKYLFLIYIMKNNYR